MPHLIFAKPDWLVNTVAAIINWALDGLQAKMQFARKDGVYCNLSIVDSLNFNDLCFLS